MQGEVLSNVLGAPFSQYVIDQLNLRAAYGSSANRTAEQVQFLANKMSFTRLTSSVRVNPKNQDLKTFYGNLFDGQIPPGDYTNADSLAKNWILQAGTSQYENGAFGLRSGLGLNGAYGLGGVEQQGYRPMPGLESVTIESKGTLGSLREANISFKVWNVVQLNVMEALYFRLGYTMLLEWGHVNYFNNNGQFVSNPTGLDIFAYTGKEQIMQAITKKNKQTDGNYEAMLGTVTNFYYSFNEQGGFDCNIKLIGLGSIIDTLKINQTFVMPSALYTKVQQAQDVIKVEEERQLVLRDQQSRIDQELTAVLPDPVKNIEGLRALVKAVYPKNLEADVTNKINNASFPATQFVSGEVAIKAATSTDYYFQADGVSVASNTELNSSRAGLFLSNNARRSKWQYIPADVSANNPVPVLLDGTALNFLSFSQRTGAYTLQTVDIARNRYNAPTFSNSVPIKTLAKNNVVALLDTALLEANLMFSVGELNPDKAIEQSFVLFVPYQSASVQKFYTFTITAISGKYTRQQYIAALNEWFTKTLTVDVTDVSVYSLFDRNDIFITGNVTNLYIDNALIAATFATNDTGLISQVETRKPKEEPTPAVGTAVDSQGDTVGAQNIADASQTTQEAKFNSALHAMLVSVKALGQAAAVGQTKAVVEVDLRESTNVFYQYGIFKDVFSALDSKQSVSSNDFDVTTYGIKGFNSSLMADKDKYAAIEDIDFKKLCTAYYVGYEFKDNEEMSPSAAEKPVYIKLGYLLAFLNNMCLLYETVGKKSGAKGNNVNTVKPYVYIDFHPEYNLCLTAPQHMTVDPYKCFIPLQATDKDYLKLFEDTAVEALRKDAFKPSTQNTLSVTLNSFKTSNAYQGKTMEILLNTQYLLDLANQFASTDKEATIALKPFLDKLLEDINKSTGGFNLFRVAYRDDSNTIIIKDDQWTPNLPGEPTIMDRRNYLSNRKYMELQVFGSGSLVRDMEFRTNMNTKMSAMIAISAQSANQSANGVDATPIGTYNTNFDDAFMTVKQNASSGSSQTNPNVKETQEIVNTMQEAAVKFDTYVAKVYNEGRVPRAQTDFAVNYYIDRFRIEKATSAITTAAPFIPANLSLTIDGISGIVMGNAFGIPENRMPASLRGVDGFSKVGFTVVGLTHTLEQNQWLTKIRGQMIKLRDITKVDAAKISADDTAFKYPSTTASALGAVDISNLDLTAGWLDIALPFIKEFEGFLEVPRWDFNRLRAGYGSDVFVTTDKKVIEVTQSTRFTQADADRTLRASLAGPYSKGVIKALGGQANWDRLNNKQKAALVSYAYNAGPGALTTWSIAQAIKSNTDKNQVAALIKRGPVTAKDVKTGVRVTLQQLRTRRNLEASLYLS